MKRIGVVGYSAQRFDEGEATQSLLNAFNALEASGELDAEPIVVSGLTNVGIPAIAYQLASLKGWQTSGYACSRAEQYECFPVDEKVIIGDNWGDESDAFLRSLDVLIRVGGGKQSLAEVAAAKELGMIVFEYELPVAA